MKKIALSFAAASVLLLAAGCSKNASTEDQSTNSAAAQPQPAMRANPPAGSEMTNAAPPTGMNTNSAGMGTNTTAATNNMNMNSATNTTPP